MNDMLRRIIISGRMAGYVRKSDDFNPYSLLPEAEHPNQLTHQVGEYAFHDEYRGDNPYSGIESIRLGDRLCWVYEYAGYANAQSKAQAFRLLKEGRRAYLESDDFLEDFEWNQGNRWYRVFTTKTADGFIEEEFGFIADELIYRQFAAGHYFAL